MAYFNFYAKSFTVWQKFKYYFFKLWQFVPIRFYLAFVLLFQLLAWFQSFVIFRRLSSDFLILHYNINFGIDLVSKASAIFYFPIIGLLLVLFDIFLVITFSQNKHFKSLAHLLLGAAIVFSVFLNLALLSISLVNFG